MYILNYMKSPQYNSTLTVSRVFSAGGSWVIALKKPARKALGLNLGDYVTIEAVGNTLVMEKVKK